MSTISKDLGIFLNIEAKRALLILKILKIAANRSLLIQELKKVKVKRTRLIPETGKIEAKKNELDRSKTNRGGIFKTFMEPRYRFQGIVSASLYPGGPEPIFVDV
jgi:hypothetical protein